MPKTCTNCDGLGCASCQGGTTTKRLPTFSGYIPPGQLCSMTRRLAAQAALAAKVRHLRQAPDSPQHQQLVQDALTHWAARSRRADLVLLGLALLLAVASYYH